jgi:hypothetical protein
MPFSIDSEAVVRRLYPSRAVVANPANSVKMSSRRHYLPRRRRDRANGDHVAREGAMVGFILGMAKGLGPLTASEDLFAGVIL